MSMQLGGLVLSVYLVLPAVLAEDFNYQACVDKYSGRGYHPWEEWSDHYTCSRYRCEIRNGNYFISAVGCRKPKMPANALKCHEYIEDENVEFPTCCSRLRCIIEVKGEKVVQIRGQPSEAFLDKPWNSPENELNPAFVALSNVQQVDGEAQGQSVAVFNSRGKVLLGGNKAESMSYIPDFRSSVIE